MARSKVPGLRQPSYFIRKEAKVRRSLEPVVFRPIERRKFMPQTRIHMNQTVSGKHPDGARWELLGQKDYWIDADQADKFIIRGYCTGNLSRNYSDDEIAQIRSNITVVDVPSTVNDRFVTEIGG